MERYAENEAGGCSGYLTLKGEDGLLLLYTQKLSHHLFSATKGENKHNNIFVYAMIYAKILTIVLPPS